MAHYICPMPPMPEYADLKESFEHRVYQSILTGWGHYFMGLGALEEIEDFDSCLAGKTESSRYSLNTAWDHFQSARASVLEALQLCLELRESLPESARNRLSPNIQLYRDTASLLEEAETAITSGGVPSLECIHGVSALIREDMVFGERMAKVNRGTRDHFPYSDDEEAEVKEALLS